MRCPKCDNELNSSNYCYFCMEYFDDDDFEDDDDFSDDYGLDDEDYDSMVDNGDAICLNCTYWSVSPYGSAYGMVCRRGCMSEGPGDSCSDFMPESHFASYGDEGQYQFNETGRAISNKLYHWKHSR